MGRRYVDLAHVVDGQVTYRYLERQRSSAIVVIRAAAPCDATVPV
jgi:hypothetical protein